MEIELDKPNNTQNYEMSDNLIPEHRKSRHND